MRPPDARPQNRLTQFGSRIGKLFTRRGTLPVSIKAAWADTEIKQDDDDRFGFRDYAAVLARQAINADTPLTIGIFGRWGSGKTSLMYLTQSELGRKRPKQPAPKTLWINVWQMGSQEELWNAFLQTLLTQVHRELPILRRLAFDGQLLAERLDFGALLQQLLINSYRILIVITPLLLTILWPNGPKDGNQLLAVLLDPWTRGGASLVLGLWLLLKPIVEAAREKVSLDLGTVLKKAPYEAQISALQKLQTQFTRLVQYWVSKNGRLVVFIDDLDRCAPDKIPAVLEALKLFTTTERCVYVLGLDYDIVRQSVAEKYHFNSAEGAEYLEKIVQIPFHLPPLEDNRIAAFVDEFYPDVRELCSTAPQVFSTGLEPNPRKVKRVLNIYRTLLQLADVRVIAWEMEPVDWELLAKMVVIQSRFRYLHDHLIRNAGFLVELEAAAEAGELKADRLTEPLRVRLLEQLTDDEDQKGLIELADLPALETMLGAGKSRFKSSAADLGTYIYLTGTAKSAAGAARPNREDRNALLSNDREKIQTQLDRILSRGQDDQHKRQITSVYVQRLEGVIGDPKRYVENERQSANAALLLLQLAGFDGNTIAAYQKAVERDPKDATLHKELGDLYFKADRTADGYREHQMAAQLAPQDRKFQATLKTVEPPTAVRPGAGRPLSPVELAEARLVFGDGLNYSRIRVKEGLGFSNWIADIGAALQGRRRTWDNAVTLGYVSYFPVAIRTSEGEMAGGYVGDMAWLIHELTHQWQYSQLGWRYLLESLRVQLQGGVQSYDYRGSHKSNEAALQAAYVAGRRLRDFNMEQQGDIARDYYLALKTGRATSAWEPFIAELRGTSVPG